MKHHAVYRMFDADGTLIYVGCTGHFPVRLDDHRVTKPWWSQVATVTISHYDSEATARAAEAVAIRTESPRYNAPSPSEVGRMAWVRRKAAQTAAHRSGARCNSAACQWCSVAPESTEAVQ